MRRHIRTFDTIQSLGRTNNTWLVIQRATGWTEQQNHDLGIVGRGYNRSIILAPPDGYIAHLDLRVGRINSQVHAHRSQGAFVHLFMGLIDKKIRMKAHRRHCLLPRCLLTEPAPETPPKKNPAHQKAPRRNVFGRALLLVFLLLCVVPLVGFAGLVGPGPLREGKTLVIPHGSNVHVIASLLDTNGIVYSPVLFRIGAKLIAFDTLKAGEYQFSPEQSAADIVLMMHEGHSVIHKFTVSEGLTSSEIVRLLEDTPGLAGDVLSPPPEGTMLPETYVYSYSDSRQGMIQRMQKDFQDALGDLWAKRDPSLPLKTPEDAVIMASIIEKETGKPAERPRIAAVFYNRLRLNMRLQSDPTVIYAITKAKGPLDHNLDHDDLAFISPYNTYTADGLPPAPICNPGRASLDAALHPEQNDFLYFVADGTGGHVFAKDLDTHNQNVAKWNALKPKPEIPLPPTPPAEKTRNAPMPPAAASSPVTPPTQTPVPLPPVPSSPSTAITTPAALPPQRPSVAPVPSLSPTSVPPSPPSRDGSPGVTPNPLAPSPPRPTGMSAPAEK